MKKNVHEIASDTRLNPELRKKVGRVRGNMMAAAEATPLPDRFKVTPSATEPRVTITDTTTGRTAQVSLYAYSQVRETLHDLFS